MNYFFLVVLLFMSSFAQGKVLSIAGVDGGPHVLYDTNALKPGGMLPKFIDQFVVPDLKKKFDTTLEWHQAPTARLLKELEVGQLDIMCFLAKTPEREKIYSYAKEPFFDGFPSMIVRKDFVPGTELSSFSAFNGKTVTVMAGVLLPDFFTKNNIQVYPLAGFNVSDETLSLLKNKRIDGIFIHLHQVSEFIIKAHHAEKTLKVVRLPAPKFQIYLVFRKNLDPEVRDYLEKSFAKHREDYIEMSKQ